MYSDKFRGLTDDEVILYRNESGTNISVSESEIRFWKIAKDILKEPLVLILVFIALLYFYIAQYHEGVMMLVALTFVSGISIYQENKSRNAVEILKRLSSPFAKVIRNGKSINIPSGEIVCNDLIVTQDGDIIPADAEILEFHDYSVNESILTGEAMPVVKGKDAPHNLIFQATIVVSGSCVAKVIAIGNKTEYGKISQSIHTIQVSDTPLQKQIRSFANSFLIFGIIAFFVIFVISSFASKSLLEGLMRGLTLAMSLVPEEIPVAFSTFMALGAYHLYKQKVIAESPNTVETLGAATVICLDKTGTITENSMTVSAVYDYSTNRMHDYTRERINFTNVLEYAMWSSEPDPFDSMEKSIHKMYALTAESDKRTEFSLIHEYPLAGKPPMMTHVFTNERMDSHVACKGSVEGVLRQCRLTDEAKIAVQKINQGFAERGFRVLAVAKTDHDIKNLPGKQEDFLFDFIGLIAFYDPPKSNIMETLQKFYLAGIKVKILTGDFSETAIAIANQIQFRMGAGMLTGTEVMEMNEPQLRVQVNKVNLFSRMFPEAKWRVVEALKANGEVVAMTGDGVNDGPALKAAHIGIAMGLRGSELAKRTASLILMDDDLIHLVDAIGLGRRIYENLKKAIRYIISIHIPIILIVTIPLLFFWKISNLFYPIHVIFLELIMGPTCSVIFENEPPEKNSMLKEPRRMTINFFSLNELFWSVVQGLIISFACLGMGYYMMINENTLPEVRTLVFTTLIFCNMFLTLVNRSFYYSVLTTLKNKNNLVTWILAISLCVLFCTIYIPALRLVFHFSLVKTELWFLSLFISFFAVMWIELVKYIKRNRTTPDLHLITV